MSRSSDLHGKIALVTGAAGGLGTAFSQALARAGATVVLAGRRRAPLEALAQAVADTGGLARVVVMDVRDEASVHAGFDSLQAQCGGVADIVVCNAGIAVTEPALTLTVDDWSRVLETNLTGAWLVAREAARRLVAVQQPGSIITVSSILGQRAAGAVLPYAVAKAGLEHMTRCLALEWARHAIRVNALAPGYVHTPLNADFFDTEAGRALLRRVPMRRLGSPDDLLAPLLLLASDDGAFMTGSTLVVDGGHLQSTL